MNLEDFVIRLDDLGSAFMEARFATWSGDVTCTQSLLLDFFRVIDPTVCYDIGRLTFWTVCFH